jgi:hypothetical protein
MAVLLPISTVLSPERALDVVFVHVLGGDPLTTWRSGDDASTSWHHWLARKIRIVLAGHRSIAAPVSTSRQCSRAWWMEFR